MLAANVLNGQSLSPDTDRFVVRMASRIVPSVAMEDIVPTRY